MCFVEFSSILRLLNHIKQNICSKIICKIYKQAFNFNNQLYEHVRQQHQALKQRLNKTKDKGSISTLFITSLATSSKQSISPNLASKLVFIVSKLIPKQAISYLFLTSPFISPQTFIQRINQSSPLFNRKYQKFTFRFSRISKIFYINVNDFYRMFVEKTRKIRLLRNQIDKFF